MILNKELLNKLKESGKELFHESTYFDPSLTNFIDEIDRCQLTEALDTHASEQEVKDKKLLHELEQDLQEKLIAQW